MTPTSVVSMLALRIVPSVHAVACGVVASAVGYSLRHSFLIAAAVGGLMLLVGFLDVERLNRAKQSNPTVDLSRPLAIAESFVLGLPYVFLAVSFLAAVVIGLSYRAEVAAMTMVAGVLLGRFIVEQVFFRQSGPPDDDIEVEYDVYRSRTWK